MSIGGVRSAGSHLTVVNGLRVREKEDMCKEDKRVDTYSDTVYGNADGSGMCSFGLTHLQLITYCHLYYRCDSSTGDCACAAGWSGSTCFDQCPAETFGDNCQNKCQCQNNTHCDPVDGTCVCTSGYSGTL